MKSWWIHDAGGAVALELKNVPVPAPSAGQIGIRIRSASLNRGEFIAGKGLHAHSGPRPAGFEAAGEVVALGEGVDTFALGDRVMGRCDGGLAEFGCMLAEEAFSVPAVLDWDQAACATLVYGTVHDMLMLQGNLKSDEWLLVTGISSGIGVATLQLGKALGAHVIGTSGSAAKLQRLAKFGLDVPVQTRSPGFASAALAATGLRGVDLAVNTVGGSMFADCVEALGFEGRLATVGYVDGVMRAELDLMALHKKRLHLFGVSNKMRTIEHRVTAARAFARDIIPLLANGRLVPLVDKVFELGQLPEARQHMDKNAHVGKLVVRTS